MSEAIARAPWAFPRIVLVGGGAVWLLLGSTGAGLVAVAAALYLWIEFWIKAVRFKRARKALGYASATSAGDPSAPSQFGARLLYRDRTPGPRAQQWDAQLERHPFLTMGATFGSVGLLFTTLGLLGGLAVLDVVFYALAFTLFGAFVGGGVVWLSHNKSDTAQALTTALQQENIKGGPPPF